MKIPEWVKRLRPKLFLVDVMAILSLLNGHWRKNIIRYPSSSSSRSPPLKRGKEQQKTKRERNYYSNQIRRHRGQLNLKESREEGNESREEGYESHGSSSMFSPNQRTDTLDRESHERRISYPGKRGGSRSHHPIASSKKESRVSRKDDWNTKNDTIMLTSERES